MEYDFRDVAIDVTRPTVLSEQDGHGVYWLGIDEESAFRCNAYLLRDGDQALLIDPGSRAYFHQVKARVAQVMPPEQITGLVLCHQDPDVAASMVDWLDLNPQAKVYSTARTHVLLPHYGHVIYAAVDVSERNVLALPSGASLRFIEAPFLHFPGAFATYDTATDFLFSGDIWAALDMNWRLVVDNFDDHIPAMDLFHVDYMASNIAARGFVNRLEDVDVRAILPQHGSIIGTKNVAAALDYLRNLQCGLDVIYPHLD